MSKLLFASLIAVAMILKFERNRKLQKRQARQERIEKEKELERKKIDALKSQSQREVPLRTNRKQAIVDSTDYDFSLTRLFEFSPQADVRKLQARELLRSIVMGQVQTEDLVMTFYSHDEFDWFEFVQNGNTRITREMVELKLMRSSESRYITFPFAIKLTRHDWELIESHQLAEYFESTQFTSIHHTYMSEIGWYYIFQNKKNAGRKLLKYRAVGKISQKTIDKFVALYVLNIALKPFNLNSSFNFEQVIEDLQDDDLSIGQNLDDFRELNDVIVASLQKTISVV